MYPGLHMRQALLNHMLGKGDATHGFTHTTTLVVMSRFLIPIQNKGCVASDLEHTSFKKHPCDMVQEMLDVGAEGGDVEIFSVKVPDQDHCFCTSVTHHGREKPKQTTNFIEKRIGCPATTIGIPLLECQLLRKSEQPWLR